MEKSELTTGKHQNKTKLFLLITILLVIGVMTTIYLNSTASPVPKSVRKTVKFDVYYPDSKKLPVGYNLDRNSFSSNNQAILYTISGKTGKINVSVQQRPSDSDIKGFYAVHLALRNNLSLPIGTAAIGAINNGANLYSFVSIPTNTNAWIIVNGPANINQDDLKQILRSFKK